MIVMKRKQAAAKGMKKYYTGVKCIRGHEGFRYVNSGACTACVGFYTRDLRKRNREQAQLSDKNLTVLRLRVYKKHVSLLEVYAAWLRLLEEM